MTLVPALLNERTQSGDLTFPTRCRAGCGGLLCRLLLRSACAFRSLLLLARCRCLLLLRARLSLLLLPFGALPIKLLRLRSRSDLRPRRRLHRTPDLPLRRIPAHHASSAIANEGPLLCTSERQHGSPHEQTLLFQSVSFLRARRRNSGCLSGLQFVASASNVPLSESRQLN